jgi:hypothetical protein
MDAETKAAYVLAYERLGEHKPASAAIGVSYDTTLRARKKDPEFEEDCKRASQRYSIELLEALKSRAVTGVVVSRQYDKDTGELISERIQYSDRLLELAIRRHVGAYGDVKSGADDGESTVRELDVNGLDKNKLDLIRQLAADDE